MNMVLKYNSKERSWTYARRAIAVHIAVSLRNTFAYINYLQQFANKMISNFIFKKNVISLKLVRSNVVRYINPFSMLMLSSSTHNVKLSSNFCCSLFKVNFLRV